MTIHTRQLQQYTQENYNNTHKTANNNAHKTTTTIHTRQLQKYTRSTNNNYTKDNFKLATKHRDKLEFYNMYKR